MKQYLKIIIATLVMFIPVGIYAQSGNSTVNSFQAVLRKLYGEMMELSTDMIQVAMAIGGFGAIWYIGVRVWKHIAAAESIDFFPLFRPFIIALIISMYPKVLALFNDVLAPTVAVTKEIANNAQNAVDVQLERRGEAILKSEEWKTLSGGIGQDDQEWKKYEQQEGSQGMSLGQSSSFFISLFTNSFTYLVKLLLSLILEIVYYAAVLCIDTIRTFQLVIISILGPFVLCLSMYDGFQQLLVSWLSRFINVYLWLPVAHLMGAMIAKIQEGMLKISITDMGNGNLVGFGQTDIAYMIFLIIAIVSYFSIPAISSYIIQSSGTPSIISKITQAAVLVKSGGLVK